MLTQMQKEKLGEIVWTHVAKIYSSHSLLSPEPTSLSFETKITKYYPIEYVGDEESNRFNLVVSNIMISLNYFFKTTEKIDFSFREELGLFLYLGDIYQYFYEKMEKVPFIETKI